MGVVAVLMTSVLACGLTPVTVTDTLAVTISNASLICYELGLISSSPDVLRKPSVSALLSSFVFVSSSLAQLTQILTPHLRFGRTSKH